MADQNTGRALDWGDSIEHDGSDWVLLPAGEYPFRVERFERKRFARARRVSS